MLKLPGEPEEMNETYKYSYKGVTVLVTSERKVNWVPHDAELAIVREAAKIIVHAVESELEK